MRGADRLLACYRLPLFLRGTGSFLAATTLLSSLPIRSLAQEWQLYGQLEASNWGRAGSVTLYEYDDNGPLTRKTVEQGRLRRRDLRLRPRQPPLAARPNGNRRRRRLSTT